MSITGTVGGNYPNSTECKKENGRPSFNWFRLTKVFFFTYAIPNTTRKLFKPARTRLALSNGHNVGYCGLILHLFLNVGQLKNSEIL